MKTATGLALIALGAILTFAVSARTPGVNLQAVGLIIMVTGLAGLFVPGRATGWLHRRVVLRRVPAGPSTAELDDLSQPSYLIQDPAVMASQLLKEAELADAAARANALAATTATAGQTTTRMARSGTRPDDALTGLAGEQEPAGRARRSRAAAILDDLFKA